MDTERVDTGPGRSGDIVPVGHCRHPYTGPRNCVTTRPSPTGGEDWTQSWDPGVLLRRSRSQQTEPPSRGTHDSDSPPGRLSPRDTDKEQDESYQDGTMSGSVCPEDDPRPKFEE